MHPLVLCKSTPFSTASHSHLGILSTNFAQINKSDCHSVQASRLSHHIWGRNMGPSASKVISSPQETADQLKLAVVAHASLASQWCSVIYGRFRGRCRRRLELDLRARQIIVQWTAKSLFAISFCRSAAVLKPWIRIRRDSMR